MADQVILLELTARFTLLSFLAVGREGVETALFMVGYAEASTFWPLAGLIVGVLIAVAIAYGMYKGAVRMNLAKFFKYTGIFLIVVAAGILSYGIGALQTVGWLPGLAHKAFDITSWFNWSSWYGEIIQGVFNITPTPTSPSGHRSWYRTRCNPVLLVYPRRC